MSDSAKQEGSSDASPTPDSHDPPHGPNDLTESQSEQAADVSRLAPYDLTDGRERYDWPTRWHRRAQCQIALEYVYLFALVMLSPYLLLIIWDGRLAGHLGLDDEHVAGFARYAFAWAGGLLGGVSFSLKWLYHAVAKGSWHRDRLLWRLSTPWLSAGLGFAVISMVRSGLLPLLDPDSLGSNPSIVSFAFLTGYFSDHAIGALLRLAQKVFGETRRKVEAEHHPDN